MLFYRLLICFFLFSLTGRTSFANTTDEQQAFDPSGHILTDAKIAKYEDKFESHSSQALLKMIYGNISNEVSVQYSDSKYHIKALPVYVNDSNIRSARRKSYAFARRMALYITMNTFLQQKQPAFLAHTLRYFDDIDLDINSISISRVSEEYEDKIYKTIMSISINEAFLSESFKKVLVNTIKKKTEVSFYFFSIDELANVLSKIDSLDYYISHLSGNMIEIVFFNLNRNSLNQRLKPYNLNVDDEGTLIILQEQEPTWPARSAI